MAVGSPSLGLGEYIVFWAIIAVALFALIGAGLGAGLGAAAFFFVAVALAILILWVIIARVYDFLLNGQLIARESSGGSGGDK